MHHNEHFFSFFKNREMNEMYLSISLRAFAVSMIGVFIPIYFYQRGYSFEAIFAFYALQSLFHLLASIPVAKVSSKFGIKHSMLFSIPILILFVFLLYSSNTFGIPIPVLSFFAGLSTAMFWVPYHIDFAKFSDRKNRGKQIGFSSLAASLLSVIGPIFGAMLLIITGFKMLFIIASGLLFASVIPLFFSKDLHEPVPFSLKGFFKGQKLEDILAFMGHGIEGKLNSIVWPLFLFIVIFGEKYSYLGIVSSLTMFVALFSTFFVSKFSDGYRGVVLKFGSLFNAVVWFSRSFIITPLHAFISEAFYGASQVTMNLPFDAVTYDKARNKKLVRIVLEREFYHHLGVIILFLFLIFFSQPLVEIFRYGGSLSSLMRLFF